MKTKIIFLILILLAAIPQIVSAVTVTQDLTYNSPTNQVNITYDTLNRIVTKNSTNIKVNYTYDERYQGTLTNVSVGNVVVKYEYDDKLRLVKEIRIIDGITFEKRYVYDSMDRLVELNFSGKDIEYFYNNQSRISKITNYISNSVYDAFDKILNRTYANSKVTEFVYNDSNSRLQQIKTDTIQNLNYTYDAVGNIISINDSANSRLYSMSYDFLDRLINVSIAGNTWLYSYNPIGNILKIVRDSVNTTKFIYGIYPVHAPARILTGDAGVDVSEQSTLYSVDKNRTFEFYLANDKNSTITNVNWSINFGDGKQVISTVPFSIASNETILAIVAHNYSAGETYRVNVTARSGSAYDYENVTNKFGVILESLSLANQSGNKVYFNISVLNQLNETISGINWACDNGAKSNSSFSISGLGSRIDYFNRTYSSPGAKYLNCNVTSGEGTFTKYAKFELKGIKIEDYNSSLFAPNNVTFQFTIRNYWSSSSVTWNIRSHGQLLSGSTGTLNTDQFTTIRRGLNYTNDTVRDVNITIFSGTTLHDRYNESLKLQALRIENFESYKKNETNIRVFRFNITNYWAHNVSNIIWRIPDAGVTSNSSVTLMPGESRNFTVEINYTKQGLRSSSVQAYNGTFNSNFTDRFSVNMIDVLSGIVLKENKDSTVQVFEVINNIGNQVMSWLLNTGQGNIHSTQNVSLNNSEQVIVIIETNYTTPEIYITNITVNTTSYNDTFILPVVT